MKGKHHKIGYYLMWFFIMLVFAGLVYSTVAFKETIDPGRVRNMILGYGNLAPLIYILILVTLSVASIFPNAAFIIAGGYIFGSLMGTIYSLTALVIGISIVFWLSRTLGRKFVSKIIEEKELDHFDRFFKKKGIWALFVVRLIPLFPADVISFAAGLTRMKYRAFMGISILVIIPTLIIQSTIGEILSDITRLPLFLILTGVILIILLTTLYTHRHALKEFFTKEARTIEMDFVKGIRKVLEK